MSEMQLIILVKLDKKNCNVYTYGSEYHVGMFRTFINISIL